jgi:hypothetical protein
MWRRKPQRPPPTYDDVRLVAEALSHINADLIQRHFSIAGDTATEYMARLVAEKRFGDRQPDGWHYPPIRKLRCHRPHRRQPAANKPETEQESRTSRSRRKTWRGGSMNWSRKVTLRARIKRLVIAGKTVIAQREEWKARSLAAEDLLEAERNRHASGQDRFVALRRLVAKELHPDFCTGGQLEKLQ